MQRADALVRRRPSARWSTDFLPERVGAPTRHSGRSYAVDRIDMNVEADLQSITTKRDLSEADFDRAREEVFVNEGGASKPGQDSPATGAGERNVARAEDHPDAVLAGVRFPARRSGYPNNRITFD
jgi:hypothetical protein